MFIGGSLFIALSFLGAKYKDKEYKNIQYLQDFISGSILIAFTGVLMPDIFPAIDIPIPDFDVKPQHDFELQIGPPRLIGR